MGYTLIICEKPSASKSIAEALAEGKPLKKGEGKVVWYEFERDGKKYVTAPAVGHLFTLKQQGKGWSYPVFDVEWMPSYKANKMAAFSQPYFINMEALGKEAEDVIVATDYDDEGEVIGYNILRLICGRKTAPRMKFSTMTKDELLESFLKPSKINNNQVEAGYARHYLDMYWGVNFTRALTLAIKVSAKRFKILSTGRVQGPVLHMVSKHEKKIKDFVPKPFWELEADVIMGKQQLKAFYEKDKMWNKADAESVLKSASGKKGTIADIKKKLMIQKPPKPYNTTSFLADIYRFFGYSPHQAMNIAESLYQAGLMSYPRTSSEKLPPDINYAKIIGSIAKNPKYAKDAGSLLKKQNLRPEEGSKTDPAHPAIYPTGEQKKMGDQQQKVYDLCVRRFLACFGEPAKRESQKIIINIGGNAFFVNGKKTIEAGWTELYGKYGTRDEVILPHMEKGVEVQVKKVSMTDKQTSPPARFSQGSVLKEMENRGIGTKCLTGDCKIITPDLDDIRLDELWKASKHIGYENDVEIRKLNTPTTVSLNEMHAGVEFKKPQIISRRRLNENEKLIMIKTKGGELKATSEHPIYLHDNEKIIIKEAGNVSKGDKILSVISRNKLGDVLVDNNWFLERNFKARNGMYVSRFSSKNALGIGMDKLPLKWSGDMAWILGYFYGDGSYNPPKYNGSHQLYFTTTEKKALDILKNRIKRVFGAEPKAYLVKNGRCFKVQCNSAVSTILAFLFPSIASKSQFEIPHEFVGDFLRGFFDADGNVHLRDIGNVTINGKEVVAHGVPRVKITLANEKLIIWIKELLGKIGINVDVHGENVKLKGKYFKCFTIRIGGRDNVDNFAWKVGFDVPHKKSILYKGLTSDSPHYKRLKACYSVVIALQKQDMDIVQLSEATGLNGHEAEMALKRLVKLDIVRRKRLSPYNSPPNRVIYRFIDKDYYFHALRSVYRHISGEFYAAEVEDVKVIEDKDAFVYDISVSADSPNFITNGGVLVHNSTRAQILQILYNRGYIIGRSIEVTELGMQLADILEKNVQDLVSEKLTRHFEQMMEEIAAGKRKREEVLDEARKKIEKIGAALKKKEKKIGDELTSAVIATQDRQSILGKCLKCGGTLKVHKNWRTGKRFVGCSGYKKGCRVGFPLPREGVIMSTEKECEHCKTPIIHVRPSGRRPFRMCLDPECKTKEEWLDKAKLKQVQDESKRSTKLAEKLKCNKCGKSLKSQRSMSLHMKKHGDEK